MVKQDSMLETGREHKQMDDYPQNWFTQYHAGELTQEEMHILMCEFREQAQARWQAETSPEKFPHIKGHIEELEKGDNRDSQTEIAATNAVDLAEKA